MKQSNVDIADHVQLLGKLDFRALVTSMIFLFLNQDISLIPEAPLGISLRGVRTQGIVHRGSKYQVVKLKVQFLILF